MNKLDLHPRSLTSDAQLDRSTLEHASVSASLEPTRRLIILVPADSDSPAVTRRVWELAHATGMRVQLLSLCKDAAQEPTLRRELVTMSALIQDGRVRAEAKVEIAANWVEAVKRNYQTGDMIVCFAEQRAGLLSRPLSQILQASLNAPVYILSGLYAQNPSGSNWLFQIAVWAGSIGIIVGSAFLQIRITSLAQDWAQTTLLILSVLGELWLIWGWNSLFG